MESLAPLPSAVPGSGRGAGGADLAKAVEACREFEAYLWNVILETARVGEMDGGEAAMGLAYSGLIRGELARTLAKTAPLGIGEAVYRSLIERREVDGSEDG